MARNKHRKSRGRGRRGGAAPLDAAPYPGSNSAGQWNASVGGNQVASAANNFKSFLGGIADKSGGVGANPALARQMVAEVAMKGHGQGGGGSRRHKRNHKVSHRRGSRKMRQSQAQSQSQSQSQSGGMFATFGALIKEALVPLGLLAMQQGYGKSYGKKHRSSKNHTRKHRGGKGFMGGMY